MAIIGAPTPVPTPSQKKQVLGQQPSWNQQWNQIWNQSWNAGFNRGSKPSVNPSFNSAVEQGYNKGLAEYNKRQSGSQVPSPTSIGVQQTSGGGQPTPSGNQNQVSDLFESAPPPPDFEQQYGNLFNEALSALDQQITARQGSYDTDVQGFSTTAETQKKGLGTQLEEAKAQYGVQEERATQQTAEAKNELRRQFAEQQQGIQAKFGGTTGTGSFVATLQGNKVLELMASNNQNLQNTLQDIGMARVSTINQVNQKLFEVDENMKQLQREAKSRLEQDIAEIKTKKATVQGERQARMTDAMNNYRSVISDINQRNTTFRQQLYKQQQDFENQIQAKKYNAVSTYNTSLNKTLTSLLNKDNLSTAGVQGLEQQAGYPAGTFLSLEDQLKLKQKYGAKDKDEYSNDSLANQDY